MNLSFTLYENNVFMTELNRILKELIYKTKATFRPLETDLQNYCWSKRYVFAVNLL